MSRGRYYGGGGGASAKAWEPEDDAVLRRLRDEGLSCAEIGQRINRSANSVVGRANRLGLGVPVPGWTDEELETLRELWADVNVSKAAIARRLERSKDSIINKARRLGLSERSFKPGASLGRQVGSTGFSAKRDVVEIERVRIPLPVISVPRARSCQWPEWGWREAEEQPVFCGAPVEPGKPYCLDHCERAYRRSSARTPDKVFTW